MRLRAAALGLACLCACGSAGKKGSPVSGEGLICTASSSCTSTESCVSTGAYASAPNECRTSCTAGCSNGETCNAEGIKNAAGQDDGTCQCVPVATAGAAGDPCEAAGLVCHPDFFVCVATQPAGTICPAGQVYSPLWSLCMIG